MWAWFGVRSDHHVDKQIRAVVVRFWHAHNAKMTVDVSYLPNGTPFANTGADILQSNDQSEFVLRTQFQLLL